MDKKCGPQWRRNFKGRFESGDNLAALEAIAASFSCKRVPPDWAREYFLGAFKSFYFNEVGSIADAFSIPDIKHHAKKHDWSLAEGVYISVQDLVDSGISLKGNRNSTGAFEIVAEQYKSKMFDCSPAKIRDMYDFARKRNKEMIKKWMEGKTRSEIEQLVQSFKDVLEADPEN